MVISQMSLINCYLISGPKTLQVRLGAPLDGGDEVAQSVLDPTANGEAVAVRHVHSGGATNKKSTF